MCSRYLLKRMETNYQGDLTDIIRASGGNPPLETHSSAAAAAAVPQWQFPANSVNYPTCPVDDFGDPFAHLRDPLIHGSNIDAPPPLPGFFHGTQMIKAGVDGAGAAGVFVGNNNLGHKIIDDEIKRPPNIFSRMLQISPTAKLPLSPRDSPLTAAAAVAAASPTGLKSDHTLISPSNSKGCLVESSLQQISSPRNTGIRRRKSQAKKVVCIPAPAPAGSRPSGEVVPSDLWAWRKYGQKPIKGSPYPRGYYRCSSSKGCSARKQVERSRTDPNMLVITYTSEHNHPWPTQRNALAGSTRSQPSKAASGGGGKTSPNSAKATNPKEEQKETSTEHAVPSAAVKEEAYQEFDNNKMSDDAELDDDFSYKPTMPEPNHSEDSFFADLGEIEGDSLDMLFTQGFDERGGKGLDSFTFYDWATGSGNVSASAGGGGATSHGESEKDS